MLNDHLVPKVISAKNLCYDKQGKRLLSNLSFTLPAKPSVTTVIGPNGAGKSTLLKIMAGLLRPSYGTLKMPFERRVGYMPQVFHTHPFLPIGVTDFLNLTPGDTAFKEKTRHTFLKPTLKNRLLHTLSFGEKQHVLFVKALMNAPSILLLDEPTQGLDLQQETHFYEQLWRFHQKNHCHVIMASHDLHIVFKKSHFILCIDQKVCCSGSPETFKENKVHQEALSSFLPKDLSPYYHPHTPIKKISKADIIRKVALSGCSSMVERELPKLHTRVRFPSSAPKTITS